MRICVVPGSFDPITCGHVDVVKRALAQYDRVIVAVLNNLGKNALASTQERLEMIKKCFLGQTRIEVEAFDGLLMDYAKRVGACAVVRGLRDATDYNYEARLAALNHMLAPDVETIFLAASEEYVYTSSSAVREIGTFGGDFSRLVPPAVLQDIRAVFDRAKGEVK